MRILVAEDEKRLASYLKKGLEENSFAVDLAPDGEEAAYMLESKEYDLVILDIMLPKIDGIRVLKKIRQKGIQTPVLMLTAKDSVSSKVDAFEQGADDYLTKPFSFIELCARVRALLRRGKVEPQTKLKVGDLEMDLISHQVTRAGNTISLTSKEFSLLEFFMRNPSKVLTRTVISEHVWDYSFDNITSNVIDVLVNRLRNKIDKDFDKKLIHTIKGVGYILQE